MTALRNQINLTGASINSEMFDPFASLGNMPAWMSKADCATVDPALFFPGQGGTSEPARTICASCPVREECLQYALDNGERFGVWGGLSERQRRRLKDQEVAA